MANNKVYVGTPTLIQGNDFDNPGSNATGGGVGCSYLIITPDNVSSQGSGSAAVLFNYGDHIKELIIEKIRSQEGDRILEIEFLW